jgi:hypothetical protein
MSAFRRPAFVVVLAVTSLGIALIAGQIATSPASHPAPSAPEPVLEPEPAPAPEPELTAPSAAAPPSAPAPSASPADAESERLLAAEIRLLVAAGQIGRARARANAYYERFPHGASVAELGRLTGAHPRRDLTDTRR